MFAHCEARRLARKIRRSLVVNRQEWCTAIGGLTHGDFRIVIIPKKLRILDDVRLYNGNSEIWIPFLQRLRIRSLTRGILACRSNRKWDYSHTQPAPEDPTQPVEA